MGSARPWQIILFVLAVLALAGGLFLSCRGGVDLADSILMVDVNSGDRFRFDTSGKRGVIIPAKHPETGERTLLPIYEMDGQWVIAERYRAGLGNDEFPAAAVDLETYAVSISDKPVRDGRPK